MRTGRDSRPLIRDARTGDAAAIAGLLGQLGYPADAAAVTRRLERLGEDRLVVAETDGAIAGLAQLHVSPSLEYDRPAGKLAALVVDQAHQQGGVGRALVGGNRGRSSFTGLRAPLSDDR